MPTKNSVTLRGLFIVPAAVCMLAGLDAALLLLGVPAPYSSSSLADSHGVLMTLGFVGTLISLERAIAVKNRWGYLSPLLLGAGGVALLVGVSSTIAFGAMLAGCIALCAVYVPLWHRNRENAVLIQALGAVLAAIAALLLTAQLPPRVVLVWLAGFVILTIAGERLELARFALTQRDTAILLNLSFGFLVASAMAFLFPQFGYPLLGVVLAIMTLWLAWKDVARTLVRSSGSRRFMASCMLLGYFWLSVASCVWIVGPAFEGQRYDAVIHAIFIGFTMSMIMAHASTILPAVIRRPLPYRTVMWVPMLVVHLALLVRVWLGDFLGLTLAHQIGGVGNVIGLLAFFVIAVGSCVLGESRKPKLPAPTPYSSSRATSGSSSVPGATSGATQSDNAASPSTSEGTHNPSTSPEVLS